MQGLPAAPRYWVALSGGLDSSVLLEALARGRDSLPGELVAVHVNHGLQPSAPDWQRHCEALCARLKLPLTTKTVQVDAHPGEGLEAAARERRYTVFREILAPGEMLLLAHHEDDQSETFLLQALRGAGVRGLAAMPAVAPFAAGTLVRPLLGYQRAELEAWAKQQGLKWVEDPSNRDTDYDRNYLRREVLPLVKRRWPAAGATVSRSARFAAEAEALLEELAAEDGAHYRIGLTLPVKAITELSSARSRNLLRHWLRQRGLPLPPAHKLDEILLQAQAGVDRNPCIGWAGAEVRRYRGRLHALEPLPEAPPEFHLHRGESRDLGPGLGSLALKPAVGEGIRAELCGPRGLRVVFRSGGEECRPTGYGHQRPLKKWLQELHVVPWLRGRLPLLYAEQELLAVAGLFACEPHAAAPGEAGLRVEWLEHPPLK
ncbi:MAG TPA: tRNA lysidine(34) synthetase TilS [Gammaproteobacteria bacterium]|nr:tRNA lysidine(34) synthetase TilS [Gammaproteobacteria bacterium]